MVEWKKLGEVCQVLDSQRKPVSKGNRSQGEYPYYGANGIQDYVDGYIFDGTYLLLGEDGSVINTDNSPVLHWATGKIWVNNHAHILQENNKALLRYLYYTLQCTDVSDIVRGMPPKINQANMRNILIPIPSLEEQTRIVGILDTFTSAIENLKEQIAQRRKQCEYYRDQLLDLEGKPGVEMKTLGEVCEVCTGGEVPNNTIKGQLSATEEYPYAVYANGKETYGYSKTYQIAEDAVCISSIGANTGAVFYKKGKFTPAIRLKVLIPKDGVITKYLFYASSKIDFRGKNTGSVPNINANYVKNKQIPLPPLQEQQRIVSILDSFEASIQNLEAQLEQREKQYEYYRNKLMTFE